MKSKSNNNQVFCHNGVWSYKLPCPFRSIKYLPLCASDISTQLHVSLRTATRICKGERALSHAELLLLQFRYFGYIDDPDFTRAGFFVRDGVLRCHRASHYEQTAGEILEFALLRGYYQNALSSLLLAQKRIKELENPEPKKGKILFF